MDIGLPNSLYVEKPQIFIYIQNKGIINEVIFLLKLYRWLKTKITMNNTESDLVQHSHSAAASFLKSF